MTLISISLIVKTEMNNKLSAKLMLFIACTSRVKFVRVFARFNELTVTCEFKCIFVYFPTEIIL